MHSIGQNIQKSNKNDQKKTEKENEKFVIKIEDKINKTRVQMKTESVQCL